MDRSPDQLPSRSALPQPTISFTLGTPHPSDLDHSKCVKKWTSCLLQPTSSPRGSAVVLCKASQSLSVLPVTDSILGYCLSLWKASVIVSYGYILLQAIASEAGKQGRKASEG